MANMDSEWRTRARDLAKGRAVRLINETTTSIIEYDRQVDWLIKLNNDPQTSFNARMANINVAQDLVHRIMRMAKRAIRYRNRYVPTMDLAAIIWTYGELEF